MAPARHQLVRDSRRCSGFDDGYDALQGAVADATLAVSAEAIHSIKYQVDVAGKRVGEEAVQIHGGMGVTWELDVAHYFKRLTAIGLIFGNADWHLEKLIAADCS